VALSAAGMLRILLVIMNSVVTTPPESLHSAADSRQLGLAVLRVFFVDIPAVGFEFEQSFEVFEWAWDYFRVPGRSQSRGRNAIVR
jgi:hypothetical protein